MSKTRKNIPQKKPKQEQIFLQFDDNARLAALCGSGSENLRKMEELTGVTISTRGNEFIVEGRKADIETARQALESLWLRLKEGVNVDPGDVLAAVRFANNEPSVSKHSEDDENAVLPAGAIKTRKKTIFPKTPQQAHYVQMIRDHDMVFGLGPAGTGKTYLAVAMAVEAFFKGKIERMIFCRPAVEAGEKIGFLPGDMREKIDPYLRPIFDALNDMMPNDMMLKKMADGEIEIAPLAFMRGRTLSNAFVVLDEAQNATPAQMKMFLTRMGENTRMVITGDPLQSDLPKGQESGLDDARKTLQGIEEIGFVRFSQSDVVRHALVQRIVSAYERNTR